MRALVVTTDPLLAGMFAEASGGLGIDFQASGDLPTFSDELSNAKFEGVVLDFDTIPSAVPAVASVRRSHTNGNAVIFAIASDSTSRDQAFENGAHFLLQRPIERLAVRQVLDAAYDLMHRERRMYFRCSAELAVSLTRDALENAVLHCTTSNVSNNGLGIKTPRPLKLAEPLEIALSLPCGFVVGASGLVIWDDKHGKSGLTFNCHTSQARQRLDSWLDQQFGKGSFTKVDQAAKCDS
jgi:DNA-binding response OmpR family regulator